MRQLGACCWTCKINSQLAASPPRTKHWRGRICSGGAAARRAARWEGTILRQSIAGRLKYSPRAAGSVVRLEDTTCKHPPPHREGKIAVLPKSAAKVETVAKLAPAGSSSLSQMPLR